MLLWQMIVRDAETLLSSPDAAWEWFEKHSPRMWIKAEAGEEVKEPERLWTADAWKECCLCVQNLQQLVGLKEKPDSALGSLVHFFVGFFNRYLDRHARIRYRPGVSGVEVITEFVHWPSGKPVRFYNGDAPDECPGAFWAYVFLSVDDQHVGVREHFISLRGGGHCENPTCGKLIGMTAGGKPRSGLCAACRQRQHRSENPDDAKKANRIHNRAYRKRKKRSKKQK